MLFDYLAVIILIILTGCYAGSETGFISLNRVKIFHSAKKGKKISKLLVWLTEIPDRFLTTTLMGTNVMIVSASSMGLFVANKLLINEKYNLLIDIVIITPLILIFGEIIPKSIFRDYPDKLSKLFSIPIALSYLLFYPLIKMVSLISRLILWFTGTHDIYFKNLPISQNELSLLLKQGAKCGTIPVERAEIFQGAVKFGTIQVKEIMIPRISISAMGYDWSKEKIVQVATDEMHTRFPVYKNDLDHIVGFINTGDLLHSNWAEIRDIIREILYVPDTQRISMVLQEMKSKRIHIAVVVDEHGGTAGLVSMKEILEEIVGDISDEYNMGDDWIKKISKNTFLLSAQTEIETVEEILNLEITRGDYETVGGLLIYFLKTIPQKGDFLEYKNVRFTVLSADERRIKVLKADVITNENEK